MSVDFWVETASPIKNPIKDAFLEYSKKIYEEQGFFLSSYFPSAMGGDMPVQDYLINMNVEDAPENYLTMGFSECSSLKFYEKFIKSGVYNYSRIVAWFPEAMVVDLKRLGPQSSLVVAEPEGITFEVPNPNTIIVKGINKQAVGQIAAVIRGKRPPEPYHGKGVKYADEHIRRKAGKAGK